MSEVLRLDAIVRDGRTQIRGAFYDTIAQEYADAMKAGAVFPDIAVFFDGEKYYLADGFHRVEAARLAGSEVISAQVLPGGVRDAILYAVGANAKHGIRRTNEDKRLAVKALLADPEWRQWSDHEIARRAQVDPKTVGNIRRGMEASGEIPQVEIRQTANGVTMDTTGIGGKPALTTNPSLSGQGEERQDGQAAGKISPEMWYPVDHRSKVVYDDPSGSQELARVRVLYHSLVNVKGKDALHHIQRGYSVKAQPGLVPQTIWSKLRGFQSGARYPVDEINRIIYDAPLTDKSLEDEMMKAYPDCGMIAGMKIYQFWHDVIMRYGEYEVRPAREINPTPDPSPSTERGEIQDRASDDPYGDAGEEEVDPADEMEDEEGSEIEDGTEAGEDEPDWDEQGDIVDTLFDIMNYFLTEAEAMIAYLNSERFKADYDMAEKRALLVKKIMGEMEIWNSEVQDE